ncbi:hypothetical protein B0H16DRAFT_1586974 [Mycena metata]|uniref:Uncharacterized protein n=1 Tax=Mycena metata TaxID=1033252 RepID=A0AAD7HVI9_9AGAR|nr:hypothetical protein B0H16DRAFT_1586974 [Mycena metata]
MRASATRRRGGATPPSSPVSHQPTKNAQRERHLARIPTSTRMPCVGENAGIHVHPRPCAPRGKTPSTKMLIHLRAPPPVENTSTPQGEGNNDAHGLDRLPTTTFRRSSPSMRAHTDGHHLPTASTDPPRHPACSQNKEGPQSHEAPPCRPRSPLTRGATATTPDGEEYALPTHDARHATLKYSPCAASASGPEGRRPTYTYTTRPPSWPWAATDYVSLRLGDTPTREHVHRVGPGSIPTGSYAHAPLSFPPPTEKDKGKKANANAP